MDWPTRLFHPWNSPGKNTGVGCHSLLQGIFRTQGLNSGLLHFKRILYHLSHQESPKILLVTVRLVKAMVFPVVMYGCKSWTVKRLSAEELMLLNCGVGEDS